MTQSALIEESRSILFFSHWSVVLLSSTMQTTMFGKFALTSDKNQPEFFVQTDSNLPSMGLGVQIF